MAQPTMSETHVDQVLTNLSVAYVQSQTAFIANRVFPRVTVQRQSDKYFVYKKNDWFRDEAQRRPDATESAGSGYGIDTATYSADVWAVHKDIGDQTRANADNSLDMDRDAAAFVTQRLLLRQEIQWVSDYFTTGIWGTDVVGGTGFTLWDTYATSDPVGDVEVAKTSILSTTGLLPNTLVLGYEVFTKLRNHPDFIDRVKYTSGNNISTGQLAAFFEVDNVYVAKAVKATNVEGETAAYSFTHGKSAWLGYVAPNPGILTPSAGYTFMWEGVSDGLGTDLAISRFRMPLLRADRIEGQIAFDNKVVATDLGYFFSAAVA